MGQRMQTVQICTPAGDLPAQLRRIADDVESGAFLGQPITTAVFVAGGVEGDAAVWRRAVLGPRQDAFSVRGLLNSVTR